MNRVILTPATLPSSALAELKQWLGITTDQDDVTLSTLLPSALDLLEAFTGQVPLEVEVEEIQNSAMGWVTLSSLPVQAVLGVVLIDTDGTRTALTSTDYEADLCASGEARLRLLASTPAGRIAIRLTCGLVPDWDSLPDALRHGVIRLAAHQHRERETAGSAPLPPASVAALWRPWRRMRLA